MCINFQKGDFTRIGILVGMSFIHGGSGYPFFAPSLYKYVCGESVCSISPSVAEVPDHELRTALVEVYISTIYVCGVRVVHACHQYNTSMLGEEMYTL